MARRLLFLAWSIEEKTHHFVSLVFPARIVRLIETLRVETFFFPLFVTLLFFWSPEPMLSSALRSPLSTRKKKKKKFTIHRVSSQLPAGTVSLINEDHILNTSDWRDHASVELPLDQICAWLCYIKAAGRASFVRRRDRFLNEQIAEIICTVQTAVRFMHTQGGRRTRFGPLIFPPRRRTPPHLRFGSLFSARGVQPARWTTVGAEASDRKSRCWTPFGYHRHSGLEDPGRVRLG